MLRKVFELVSDDEMELPLMCCDSLKEMADTIPTAFTLVTQCYYLGGTIPIKGKRYKIVDVMIDDDE